jgi:hypothetical protein
LPSTTWSVLLRAIGGKVLYITYRTWRTTLS